MSKSEYVSFATERGTANPPAATGLLLKEESVPKQQEAMLTYGEVISTLNKLRRFAMRLDSLNLPSYETAPLLVEEVMRISAETNHFTQSINPGQKITSERKSLGIQRAAFRPRGLTITRLKPMQEKASSHTSEGKKTDHFYIQRRPNY